MEDIVDLHGALIAEVVMKGPWSYTVVWGFRVDGVQYYKVNAVGIRVRVFIQFIVILECTVRTLMIGRIL